MKEGEYLTLRAIPHHFSIEINRERPEATAYNRKQRTARFPVNTRKSASSRDDR